VIAPLDHDPSAFDVVVVGGPVWVAAPCTPVRAFLRQHVGAESKLAYFVSYGSSGAQRALAKARAITRTPPVAELAVRQRDVDKGLAVHAVRRFAIEIAQVASRSRGVEISPEV
jgi:hypothetical protein